MKFKTKWPGWKLGIGIGILVIVIADLTLGVVLVEMGREAPLEMAARRDQLSTTAKQLEGDVARGEKIRSELGTVGHDSDQFYQNSFLDSHTVYSTVDADIAAIAMKSGVKTNGFTFKPTPVANRNVSELDITTTVDGDYPGLLQFVNAIERSKNFYFLNQLQLTSAGPNGMRLQVDLHTYYRT
jgi:type IV pilus assembly protein PilO